MNTRFYNKLLILKLKKKQKKIDNYFPNTKIFYYARETRWDSY